MAIQIGPAKPVNIKLTHLSNDISSLVANMGIDLVLLNQQGKHGYTACADSELIARFITLLIVGGVRFNLYMELQNA